MVAGIVILLLRAFLDKLGMETFPNSSETPAFLSCPHSREEVKGCVCHPSLSFFS